jgi:predicted alpha/beta-hydrolase family hydrolase
MESFPWPALPTAAEETKVAVILPGANYPVEAPLLFWTAQMLTDLGWHVRAVRWKLDDAARRDPYAFTAAAAEMAFADAPPAAARLIAAKSFGTLCIPWAERAAVPGLWLTPILTDPHIRETLARTSKSDLLVGGSNDELWDGGHRNEKNGRFVEIPDADHGLHVRGDWRASVAAQLSALAHIEAFVLRQC